MVLQHDILAILGGRAEQWNAFRAKRSESIVLHGAALRGAQFAHADLHRAILRESDLRCANISSAILERAVLRKTDFRDSNLQKANVDRADLSSARDLTDAQIGNAFGSDRTRLPEGMARPGGWNV